jgi:CheY-like chemotaxis protein
VADTGPGIPQELHERIFEPFYTTKGVGKGTGLGLATVYGIIKQSGGYVWVESEPDRGAEFVVILPAIADMVHTKISTSAEARLGGTETLLVVEDEDALRDAMGAYLRSLGYTVLLANSGPSALSLAGQHEHIDLLITDMVMPKMSGSELTEILTGLRPGLKVIQMSGYTDDAVLRQGAHEHNEQVLLHKPFSLSVLARRLRETLDAPGTSASETLQQL